MTRRLFCTDFTMGQVRLTGPEAHHGRNVLRLSPGDEVELFDGKGQIALARVDRLGKAEILLHIENIQFAPEPAPQVVLATAIPKFAHQEILVRMGTELGVSVFAPIISERSSVREQFRPEKWERWIIEACKQCKSHYLPKVAPPVRLMDFIRTLTDDDLIIFGDTAPAQHPVISQPFSKSGRVIVLVGPEGGFTPAEIETMKQARAVGLRIGRQILRIETAAIALTTVALLLTADREMPENFSERP
ncbi:MAG: 16S rRNA (uracil(1498)-N(3))-methyltransferase [Phycisphaerae bacterium]|nr:16S rRNA (uracil(1498)-N(3))-methyltransferase [Phycisphaerae bacterium]